MRNVGRRGADALQGVAFRHWEIDRVQFSRVRSMVAEIGVCELFYVRYEVALKSSRHQKPGAWATQMQGS